MDEGREKVSQNRGATLQELPVALYDRPLSSRVQFPPKVSLPSQIATTQSTSDLCTQSVIVHVRGLRETSSSASL